MALISCPDCGRQVSQDADVCPQCGRPIKCGFLGKAGTERTVNVGCLIILLVFLALGMVAMCARLGWGSGTSNSLSTDSGKIG
jgi:hypothetical protein